MMLWLFLLCSLNVGAHLTYNQIHELKQQGVDLINQGKPEQALVPFAQLVALDPNKASHTYNLGYVLSQMDLLKSAVYWFEKTLQHEPEHEMAIFACAKALLACGYYKQALKCFEWRFDSVERTLATFNLFNVTPETFSGKEVVLIGEMGFGDIIQCLRYTLSVRDAGARSITVKAPRQLHPLFSLCPYIDQVIAPDALVAAHSVVVPLFSLMRIFNTQVETIPAPIPYLFSDPALDAYWAQQLQAHDDFKIGIVWASNKENENEHTYVRRNIPLSIFEPLSKLPGVSVYSLQKGDGEHALTAYKGDCPFMIFDQLDERHGPFMDTISIMKQMDLIISADTSVVHIAGALGVPIWTLLPYTADWRWLRNRTDSPWYPSMRLFRQKEPGNWGQVMDEVVKELTDSYL